MNSEVLFLCYSKHKLELERRYDEFVFEHLMGELEGTEGGDTVGWNVLYERRIDVQLKTSSTVYL